MEDPAKNGAGNMIEKRGNKDRRVPGDRRFGSNPKGYHGPERRGTFDRRRYMGRRRHRIAVEKVNDHP